MKSKQYRLSIVKNKIILKEDVAQTVTTGQIGNAVAGILKSVAGTLGNVISTLFSTYAYLIKSIVNIGSPKSVKDKINTDFNKKLKDLSRSYERSLDNIKLNNGHDFVRFMFSPSLYAYEEMRENMRDKSGVVFENINDFLDNPFNYAASFIPNLIDNITANDIKRKDFLSDSDILDTRGNINNLMKNLRDVSPQRLEQILQDVKLSKSQKKTLEMFTKQASKKIEKESYSLKITTNLLLEKMLEDNNSLVVEKKTKQQKRNADIRRAKKKSAKEKNRKELRKNKKKLEDYNEIISMADELTSEINKYSSLVLGTYKELLDDPESSFSKAINLNVSNQSNNLKNVNEKELIRNYSDTILNLVFYYQFYYTIYEVVCSLFESLNDFKVKDLKELKTFVESTNEKINEINKINYNSSYVNDLKKEIEPNIKSLRSTLNSLDENTLEEEIKKIQSNKEIDKNTSLITILSELSNDINFKDDIETAISFLEEISSDKELLEKMRNETKQFKEVLNFMKENNILENEVSSIMKDLESINSDISFSKLIERFNAINSDI